MTRSQLLSVILYLVGGGYGVSELQGHAESVKDRVAVLEGEVNQTRTALAVIEAQGVSSQRELEEVRADLKELTRSLYRRSDPVAVALPSRLSLQP